MESLSMEMRGSGVSWRSCMWLWRLEAAEIHVAGVFIQIVW